MLTTVVVVVVVVYGALVAGMYLGQRKLLYVPGQVLPSPEAAGVPEMSPVPLATADGLVLMSWYAAPPPGRPTLVYLHGNGGTIGDRGYKVRPYLDAGLGVLLVEYRGYGGNPGSPTEPGLYEDGRAALAFLEAQGTRSNQIILYGESLGSGVAIHLAAEMARAGSPVAALTLEAPLSSVVDIGAAHYPYVPVRWLLKDRFESAAKIGGVSAPVLVVHGERDSVVPIRFGRTLFAAAQEPKKAVWIAEAAHNDLAEYGLAEAVLAFLVERGAIRPEREPTVMKMP